jgi:hypothetical protein
VWRGGGTGCTSDERRFAWPRRNGDRVTDPTKQRFARTQPFSLRGFADPVSYGGLAFHVPWRGDLAVRFAAFCDRVQRAAGREFMPIYRMADGEFAFLVGWRAPVRGQGVADRMRAAAEALRRRPFRTMWGEAYSGHMARRAHERMEAALRIVARQGIIAAYFVRRGDRWGEQYLEPVWRWLDRAHIWLDEHNYVPFYFVYALLSGPCRAALLRGRRVLVVSSLTARRTAAIEGALRGAGVGGVCFKGVSPGRSMLDDIDVGDLVGTVDLALVAAGVGSVNVLAQLEPLRVPAIDCGIWLECLIDPRRRRERPFLLCETDVAVEQA